VRGTGCRGAVTSRYKVLHGCSHLRRLLLGCSLRGWLRQAVSFVTTIELRTARTAQVPSASWDEHKYKVLAAIARMSAIALREAIRQP
jgi:hypothetical protein